ncbi:ABC transporter ATP-binding protein [Streptomyces sp. NPDC004629]|uniref:ABC transporter ATP-binding protein n=1 Tax=Streptomyces sp. NPDC004629 TaxID=3364705 RepID=UPI0036C190EE
MASPAQEDESPPKPPVPTPSVPPPGVGTGHLQRPGATARMLRPVRGRLITAAFLAVVGASAGLAPYVAVSELARTALDGGVDRPGMVWTWVLVGALGALVRLVAATVGTDLGHYADAEMQHGIRSRLVRHLGVVPLGWFRDAGSSEVKRALTDDIEEMHHLIAHATGEMAGAAAVVTVSFGYLVTVDWRMALVTLAVPALLVGSYRLSMRSMPHHVRRLITAEGRVAAAAVEYADGIAVAKTFGTGGGFLRRFSAAVDEQTAAMRVWVAESRASSAASRVLLSEVTVLAVVLAVGSALVAHGSLTVSALLPFLVVGVGLPTPMLPVVQGSQTLRKARMAAAHIEDLLAVTPLPEPAEPRLPEGTTVELDRVMFSYDGAQNALTDVSFVCHRGTTTAIVGPSGAGKTTLAMLLPRFYDVTAGAVRIGGADVRSIPSDDLLAHISLVFQDVALLYDTVRENIRVGRPDATDEQVREAAGDARIHEVIERLPQGYDTVLGGQAAGLSGGERQRLSIARAILADAPVIVLDEATAAVDPDNETAIQQAVSRLTEGKTLIVIAHRLRTITDADQIVVLDQGRLVESGTHHELLARRGRCARMWRAQQPASSEARAEPTGKPA